MSYDYNNNQNQNSNNVGGQYTNYQNTNQNTGSNGSTYSTYQSGNNNYYNDSYYTADYKEIPNGKKKKGKPILAAIAILMAGILAGSGTAYGIMKANEKKQDLITNAKEQEVITEEAKEDARLNIADPVEEAQDDFVQNTATTTASETEMTVAQIAEKCLSSVVAITNKGETEIRSMWGNFTQESQSSGSGVIIGETETELLILTNYHVIEDNTQLSVVFSWEEGNEEERDDANITTAIVKDYDASHDIAVIAIPMSSLNEETKAQICVASIGDSNALALGQQVVAIGNALGYGQSVTTGIVSAMDRTVQTNSTIGSENKYIQTDAAINPGNSGGALFNMRGELVGINSAKIASGTVEGMGYAIPISQIMDAVETMMNQEARALVAVENRGYLGVNVIDVTDEVSRTYGLPKGIYINAVTENKGAGAAGLMKGDIVTAVNGKKVKNIAELKEYLSYYALGETVTVTFERQGQGGYQELQTEVVLISAEENNANSNQNEEVETQEEPKENNESQDNGTTYINPFGNLFPFGNFGF